MAVIINLRTLAARPCGACGALVDEREGCEHWSPVGSAPTRPRPVGATRVWLGQALGGRQHDFLAEAAASPDGVARSLGSRAASVAGHRLTGRGLMERITEKGAYRITESGREALNLLNSMKHKLEG